MAYIFLFLSVILLAAKTESTTFTFINKCDTTIWPAIVTTGGSKSNLTETGFELQTGQNRSISAPPGWTGRFWARTKCKFDSSGHGSCLTGDCGSDQIECNGSGGTPPATLVEISLNSFSNKDFYDVSVVDGFNLPLILEPSFSGCSLAGCAIDMNQRCPVELRVGDFDACKSACQAFGKPEFCCVGGYDASTCQPTFFSDMFKTVCPKAYSYAFDDAKTTFTCSSGGDYKVTFCPDSTASSNHAPPKTNTTATDKGGGKGITVAGDAPPKSMIDQLVPLMLAVIFILILQML